MSQDVLWTKLGTLLTSVPVPLTAITIHTTSGFTPTAARMSASLSRPPPALGGPLRRP